VDVISRRIGLRTDSTTGEIYPRQTWDPPQPKKDDKDTPKSEEEEEFEDEEGEESFEPEVHFHLLFAGNGSLC